MKRPNTIGIIKDFEKKFPTEKGMFWTPCHQDIIEFIRAA